MEEFRIERLNEKNLVDWASLYKEVYNTEISIISLRQMFNTRQFGAEYIGYIAYDTENQPAGVYSILPDEITYGDKKILCAQSGNLMTANKHRRKGLFTKISGITHELAIKEGIKFIWGVTHKDVRGTFEGLVKHSNYIHRDDFNCYDIKIQTFPLLFLANKFILTAFLYKFYFTFILLFYKKYKSFREYTIDKYGEIKKDEKYFNYKTYYKSYIISLNDTRVWFKLFHNTLFIGDIEKNGNNNFQKVFKGLKKLAFIAGIRNIQFDISPGANLDLEFNKYYKPINNFHLIFLNLTDDHSIENIKFVRGDFDSF